MRIEKVANAAAGAPGKVQRVRAGGCLLPALQGQGNVRVYAALSRAHLRLSHGSPDSSSLQPPLALP